MRTVQHLCFWAHCVNEMGRTKAWEGYIAHLACLSDGNAMGRPARARNQGAFRHRCLRRTADRDGRERGHVQHLPSLRLPPLTSFPARNARKRCTGCAQPVHARCPCCASQNPAFAGRATRDRLAASQATHGAVARVLHLSGARPPKLRNCAP